MRFDLFLHNLPSYGFGNILLRKTKRRSAFVLRFARVAAEFSEPSDSVIKKRNETPIIPFLFPTRNSLLIDCFGEAGQFGETGRIGDGEIGQHFSVDLDPGRFQSMDQLTV